MTSEVPADPPVPFGQYLRKLLDDRDVAPKWLAYKMGVHESYVRNWLRGDRLPGRKSPYVTLITKELNLPTEERKMLFYLFYYQHEHDESIARGDPLDIAQTIVDVIPRQTAPRKA